MSDKQEAPAIDDYEEGEWTPTVGFDLGERGLTYAPVFGKFDRMGSFVSVDGASLLILPPPEPMKIDWSDPKK